VFFETIANPTLEVIDIAGVADIAHAAGALVICDNVFATPTFSRAAELGADVIVYSATKHIDGQGRALGGVICGSRQHIRKVVEPYMKHTGGAMNPFTAWLMLNGLVTLDLRVRAMADSAARIAAALDGHPGVARVIYPHHPAHPQHALALRQMEAGGTMVTIEVAGGKDGAFRFLDALKVWTISNNLGDARSIATHPATTTHQRLPEAQKAMLGITPGLVRLSVGLEHADDLIADLTQALAAAG
jgi:O-succinylhomoserine sulfhydrylase